MLEHGGKLRAAAQQYGIAETDWLDLSAALNPCSYPVGEMPASVWQRLPEDDDELAQVAAHYFDCDSVLPVAGSQAAIQALPALLRTRLQGLRIGMLSPSYNEHAHAWLQAGYMLVTLQADDIDAQLDQLDALLIVNPNNPTGSLFSSETLLRWHAKLLQKNAWLIVDEAFIDATPQHSLAAHTGEKNLVVLRSLGKFFGLAGARVGFVLTEKSLLENLHEKLGPWPIAHPSRIAAIRALRDEHWQQQQRTQLPEKSLRLAQLLTDAGLPPTGSCALFQWVLTSNAAHWHHTLAQQGVLTRLYQQPASLRFGLPDTENDWQKLRAALAGCRAAGEHDDTAFNQVQHDD